LKIEIYDQIYNLQSDQDETYVRELAAYLDEKMRTVADATRAVDSLRVAILAALNITDELFTERTKKKDEVSEPLRKRVEKAVELVEKALEQTS
jgi:cell division protein ZapA